MFGTLVLLFFATKINNVLFSHRRPFPLREKFYFKLNVNSGSAHNKVNERTLAYFALFQVAHPLPSAFGLLYFLSWFFPSCEYFELLQNWHFCGTCRSDNSAFSRHQSNLSPLFSFLDLWSHPLLSESRKTHSLCRSSLLWTVWFWVTCDGYYL